MNSLQDASYTFGLAGTTDKTRLCAQALLKSGNFTCEWVLTPQPKPVGRKQVTTPNPVHLWAQEHAVPTILIDRKIDQTIKESLSKQPEVDFLLVVDFGYLVPQWLLDTPKIAPINVHPSDLPRWRGSSPAQFSLLYGDKKSGITVMIMNQGLDQGPILWQQPFSVNPTWTQTEYYNHSLPLAAQALPKVLTQLAQNQLKPQPQPEKSPTPTARQLKKTDAFVSWKFLQKVINNGSTADFNKPNQISSLLQKVHTQTQQPWIQIIEQASRAFQPWPALWTTIPTIKGQKRMKILSCLVKNNNLVLEKVQIEGQQPAQWNQVKNIVKS